MQAGTYYPNCEGDGDVVGVVTPLVRGGAQVLHGDQVVELSVQLEVQEREEKGEDGEGQVEVENERGDLKERRTWMTMRMGVKMTQDLRHEVHVTQHQRV